MPNENKLYLCFEYCEFDLKKYMKSQQYKLSAECIKSFTYQMLAGLTWCHSHRIFHRCAPFCETRALNAPRPSHAHRCGRRAAAPIRSDLKPQNVLVDPKKGTLKLADFGLARAFTVPLRTYTHEVVTLWYRAPEILLGAKQYSCPVDMWSIGTIIPEMVTGHPMFPGDSEIDEIFKIFRLLGTPNETLWQGVSQLPDFKTNFPKWQPKPLREAVPQTDRLNDAGLDLVKQMLLYTPQARITAKDALDHPYFAGLNLDTVGKIPLPF